MASVPPLFEHHVEPYPTCHITLRHLLSRKIWIMLTLLPSTCQKPTPKKVGLPHNRGPGEAILSIMCTWMIYHISTQTTRMFDIADVPFSAVSGSEKQSYLTTLHETAGSPEGYRFRQYADVDASGGVCTHLEQYCINYYVNRREHLESVRPLLPEIAEFTEHNQFNVLRLILKKNMYFALEDDPLITVFRFIARNLELPEDTLVSNYDCDAVNETSVRFIKL
ncbi:hypothetical protein DFH29DRAFT_1042205 [Suillus ampliporus]|nr:hypothetical protein DFH29DRAFT_1042205 [Suillus ampliporus]